MALPPIVVELLAQSGEFTAKMGEARAEITKLDTEGAGRMQKLNVAGKAALLGVAAGVAAIGVESVKMASHFEAQTNVLVTAAGESQAALKGVRQGILDIAAGTGTGTEQLTEGMYQIEKAGYRGAAGLAILKAAAQGAKEENADLGVVSGAMTSVMAAYGKSVGSPVQVMNALKTAAGATKDTMQNFAASLSTVLPIAAQAHIDFGQVGGALAAMTRTGMSAQNASQNLAFAIRNLEAPNRVAVKTMQQFGINSTDVAQKLGQRGLGGTLEYLTQTISKQMGPAGTILLSTFNQSKAAGDDLKTMMQNMSPAAQQLAKDLLSNTVSVSGYRDKIKDLPTDQLAMARQFADLDVKASGFSDALKKGDPMTVTFVSQLKKMMGGSAGLNAALMLTGQGQGYFDEATKRTTDSLHNASSSVEGWESTSKLLSVRLAMMREEVSKVAIEIGMHLIPIITSAMDWMQKHQDVVKKLAIGLGVLLGALVAVGVAAAALAVFGALTSPIGLAALAVGALALVFVHCWQSSEQFRTRAVEDFRAIETVLLAFAYTAVSEFHFVAEVWLDTAGALVSTAAKAFGWVPGIGPQLKEAAKGFGQFKDTALDDIDKLQSGLKTKMDEAAKQTALAAAIAGQSSVKNLEARLPAYEAIAAKYGLTLPDVLKKAHLATGEAARLLGVATAQGYGSAGPAATATALALAKAPRAALMDGDTRAATLAAAASLGRMVSQGYANGIGEDEALAIAAAHHLVLTTKMAVETKQISNSPAKLFIPLGSYVASGYALGIRGGTGSAVQAVRDMVAAVASSVPQLPLADMKAAAARALATPVDTASMAQLNAQQALEAARLAAVAPAGADRTAEHTLAGAQARDDLLRKRLAAITASTRASVLAAREHATALRSAADAAQYEADRLPSVTKAQQAAKAAAEAHAKALSQEATQAGLAATQAARAAQVQVDAAKKVAAAADAALAKAKTAAAATASASKDAAKAVTDAAAAAAQAQADLADALYAQQVSAAQKQVDVWSSALDDIKAKSDAMRASFSSAVTDGTDLKSLFGDGGANSLGSVMDALTQRLADSQKLAAQVAELQADGLSASLIQQITDAGVTSGSAIANSILTGGPQAVATLNGLADQLQTVASTALDPVVAAFYGPGASALQQFIAGMESMYPQMADSLAAVVADLSGIYGTAGGLAQPVQTPSLSPAFGSGLSMFGSGSSVGSSTVTVPVTVLLDGAVLHKSVQTTELRYQARNGRTGLLPTAR